jgi:hypothetical protein
MTTEENEEMKKSRFNEEQIIGMVKEHEAGKKVADIALDRGSAKHAVHLEKQVRRDGRQRSAAIKSAR